MKIYQSRVSLLFFLFCSSLPSFNVAANTKITEVDQTNTYVNPTDTKEQKIDSCSNHGHKELNCVCQSQWTGPNCEIRSKKYLDFF